MELFSEIYNTYFIAITKIISTTLSQGDITKSEIERIVQREAFTDSHIYVLPNLVDFTWPFLTKNESGRYKSIIKNEPLKVLSTLEKRWLKSITLDKRFQLFFCDNQLNEIYNLLKDISPLFYHEDFYYFDQSKFGDQYDNSQYRKNFSEIIKAFKENKMMKIDYVSSKNKRYSHVYEPIRLEYSQKDDIFRLFATTNLPQNIRTLRLSRILNVTTDKPFDKNHNIPETLFPLNPIVLKISNERNSLERTMLQFANYKKETEFDEQSKQFYCTIWCSKQDESDLLIRILSFGHTVEIISPIKFRKLAIEKINKQYEFLNGNQNN